MTLKLLKNNQTIFDILFAFVAFTLPLSFALPNIFLLLAFIFFILKKNKEHINTYILLVSVFGAFFILKAFINKELIANFFIYKHLLAFILISILIFNVKNKVLVKKGFVFGVLIAVLFTFIKIIIYAFKHNSIPLGNTSQAVELLSIHRPYFGFICFLGILCCSNLLGKVKNKNEAIFYKIIILVFIGFVYLIVARLALGLILIYLFYVVIKQYKLSKRKIFIFTMLFFGGLFLLINNSGNLKKRLHIKSSFDETVKVLANQEPRVVIWSCVLKLAKNQKFNYLTGYKNIKNIQLDLNNCYENSIDNVSKREYYLKTQFNTHNQFFSFFLQGGIIGLLLFLFLFVYLIYKNNLNFMGIFVAFSFIMFLLIENLFNRQIGVYLIGIFIPLFLNKNYRKINES